MGLSSASRYITCYFNYGINASAGVRRTAGECPFCLPDVLRACPCMRSIVGDAKLWPRSTTRSREVR